MLEQPRKPVDVLLICALKDEYDQVLKVTDGLVDSWQEHSLNDGWIVADASFFSLNNQKLIIRATHASYMGRENTQALASKLINQQPARCIAMSGICAGRRGKVSLGDVIFAERLWSYDAGKVTVEDGTSKFQGDQLQYRPSLAWVQRMQHIAAPLNAAWLNSRPLLSLEQQEDWVMLRLLANEDPRQHADFSTACPNWSDVLPRLWKRKWLDKPLNLTDKGRQYVEELELLHLGELPPAQQFQILPAPIGTGAEVREDEGIFPRLSDSMRKVLGIEMEASALGALGDIYNIPVLIAKGVSDYGDSFKDDRYRTFAARASAECLIALLRDSSDLLLGQPEKNANPKSENQPAIDLNLPHKLISVLAEEYPDTSNARALWQRAGGKASEVENINRSRDLWQRLWQRSIQGAAARPENLLQAALEDLPNNGVIQQHLEALAALR
jgi:nucleoside phosphorylase